MYCEAWVMGVTGRGRTAPLEPSTYSSSVGRLVNITEWMNSE